MKLLSCGIVLFSLLNGIWMRGAVASELFVSPSGSDQNVGTAEKPLLTLTAAQHLARGVKSTESGPLTIHVEPGTYYLERPLQLTAEDSGTQKQPINWQATVKGAAIISGGRRLQLTWKPYKNGILQTEVPDDLLADQLFVNGERQILARYPNYDATVSILDGHAADCISPARVARWSDPAGGFMHAMHPSLWGGFSYLITGKEANGSVKLEGGWQGNRPDKPSDNYRYVENIFEELDAPGEWFLNHKTNTLYYYPRQGLDITRATFETARLKSLFEFRGKSDKPVKWVTFDGFVFRHTVRTFMETKEPLLRSDWTIYRGGAVFFDGAEDCTLAHCYLDQVGGNAVFINNYNRRVTVRACRIEKSGAGGVVFVGDPAAVRSPLFNYDQRQPLDKIDRKSGPLTDNYPADCRVEDCLITQVGRVEKQAAGVGLDMCARITISHCSIYDVPRAGINIGDGCWGGDIIEFCDVFDTVKETGDHGSFNSWGRDRYWLPSVKEVNQLVAANKDLPLLDVVEPITLHDTRWRCDHGWDIDLDDGSSNYHIYNNLCLNGGIKNREGYNRLVENNIMVNNGFHPHVWFDNSGDRFVNNLVFNAYQPAKMPRDWGKELDYNFLCKSNSSDVSPAVELQKLSRQDSHSLEGNPMFVDPEHGHFTVRQESPALKVGFTSFPMDDFGVTSPDLRAIARTPSFAKGALTISTRDPKVHYWRGCRVRNIIGQGERSAYGLPDETGVLIVDVLEGGPAAVAGLTAGDVIIAVAGSKVDTFADLSRATQSDAGVVTQLTVYRNQHKFDQAIK